MFTVQTAASGLWRYQRTSVDMCTASSGGAEAAAALRQHLEAGLEIEHTQMSRYGQYECPTYFLRRR